MDELFPQELQRIRFRQRLMSLPGGVAWMIRMGRLFGFTCRALGPGSWGMPDGLRKRFFQEVPHE